MTLIYYSVFCMALFTYTAFIKLNFVFPIRTLIISYLCFMLFFAYRKTFFFMLRENQATFSFILVISIIGFGITILNGVSFSETLNQLLANTVQQFLILIATYILCMKVGVQKIAWTFLASVFLTGSVAILQVLDISAAWELYDFLGRIQSVPTDFIDREITANRAKGISLTPIILSYHLVVGYLMLHLLFRKGYLKSTTYFILFAVLIIMIVASGARSAFLGVLIHEAAYRVLSLKWRTIRWMLPLSALLITLIILLQEVDSRLISFDDTSATGRIALYKYGLLLALDHPLGLGWSYDPSEFAWLYWEHIAGGEKADAIFRIKIHNAFINLFLAYGIIPLIFAMFFLLLRFGECLIIFKGSIAYLIHSFFHNNIFFIGEVYYFFFLGVLLFLMDAHKVASKVGEGTVTKRSANISPSS